MHQPVSSNSLQPPSLPISSTSSFPPHPHFSPKTPAQPTTTSSISLPPLPPTFSQPIPCDHHKRKHHETYTLPEPWNDMDTIHGMDMDTIHGMEMVTGPVPARVVEYMYNQADSRAKKSANDKKLVLRKRLKESNHSETGSRSAISSRREAKVSRMYRQEYLHSTQDELRQSAKDKALLLAYLKCLRKFIDDNKLTLDERRTDNTLDAVID
ncbi:unnamed protein product [Chondrus crispus]|uniref:Uncharacterized protein n=1 Tax=Chondrus crispus TaxID=2769 RepID=R7Q9F9_CHOCR|nr:unnamed protein product [Chondrus crispus]CDF34001.1 unnamed protein product [Chondrus crispus]|eukprot:XP_005713820.1 unnamed protein product [Chondrus crispus]